MRQWAKWLAAPLAGMVTVALRAEADAMLDRAKRRHDGPLRRVDPVGRAMTSARAGEDALVALAPRTFAGRAERRASAARLLLGMAQAAGQEADELLAAGDDVAHATLLAASIELLELAEDLHRG